jgi:hypothetical protein
MKEGRPFRALFWGEEFQRKERLAWSYGIDDLHMDVIRSCKKSDIMMHPRGATAAPG